MQRLTHKQRTYLLGAHKHRHLLGLFPLTWGRHLAIRSPPSLYQQEGALRRCCSSEPVQLDTKYCRESLSFTPAERRKKKNKKIKTHSSSDRTPALPLGLLHFAWLGRWVKTYVCRYVKEQKNATYSRSKHKTQHHDMLHSSTAC